MEESQNTVHRSINYGRFNTPNEGKDKLKPSYELTADRSKSFNVDNRGQLSPSEYLEYTHYLKNEKVIGARRFPSVKPTKEDYSNLVKLVEKLGLDLD